MNEILKKFEHKAIIRGGLTLFSKQDILSIIHLCEKKGIKIYGFEGFYLSENQTRPSMDNSLDFESVTFVSKHPNLYQDAIAFINERDESLFFEITTD